MPVRYVRRGLFSNFNRLIGFIAGEISASGYYPLVRRYTEDEVVNYVYALPHTNGDEYLRIEFRNNGSNYSATFYGYYFYDSSGNACGLTNIHSLTFFTNDFLITAVTPNVIFTKSLNSNDYFLATPLKYPYNAIYTITQPVTSGNNKTIYLDSTTGIVPNSKWIISTESTAGRCLTKVTFVGSNYVVVDYVGMNVPAGSKFMKFRSSYLFMGRETILTISLPDYYYSSSTYLPSSSWSANIIDVDSFLYSNNFFIDFILGFPMPLITQGNSTSLRGFITLEDNSVYVVPNYLNLTVPIDNVIHHDIISQGIVTSASIGGIIDGSKNWEEYSLVNKYIIIPSIRECKRIMYNSSNEITVSPTFISSPPVGSDYVVCEKPFYISNVDTIGNKQIGFLTFPLFEP